MDDKAFAREETQRYQQVCVAVCVFEDQEIAFND